MAAIGDTIMYNESGDPDTPAWTVGQVIMTDTDPTAEAIAAIVASPDWGGDYPTQPDSGQVLLFFQSMLGNTMPTPAYTYAAEGDGPLQYQPLS